MKPSLQLSIHQHVTITPQLQQAIRLLQLSTVELQQEIQHQLELNPLLDIAANEEIDESLEKNTDDEFSDFQWSHLYTTQNTSHRFNQSDYPYDTLHCTTMSLKDHLIWQLNLTPMSERDTCIAMTLIDAIDDNGFLTLERNELYADLYNNLSLLHIDECEAVRHRLQRFDPIGCVSTNLAETLFVQLDSLPPSTPHLSLAKEMVIHHLHMIGRHHYAKLCKIYHVSDVTLRDAMTLILHLHPKPGCMIQKPSSEYIIPDLIVKKVDHAWRVALNPAVLPKLSINDYYATMAQKTNGKQPGYAFLRENLLDARCFLRNIQNRQDTLLKVASYIVQFQTAFIESGEHEMKPLILQDVARALNLHESTISRVTAQKFIHTPHGLFELKYFFSHAMPMKNGHDCSTLSIRARIKQLIANESTKKPLSDRKIAGILAQQGLQIARRTITKYREQMDIAPSHQRKSMSL